MSCKIWKTFLYKDQFLSLDILSLFLLHYLCTPCVRCCEIPLFCNTTSGSQAPVCPSSGGVGTVEVGVLLEAIPTRRQLSINTQQCQQII